MLRLAAFLALLASPLAAQTACGDRERIIATVVIPNALHRHVVMADASGTIEIYGRKGGRWILLRTEGGVTCVIGAGDRFEPVRDPVPGVAS